MTRVSFTVREVCQTASADYLVKYHADVVLTDEPGAIEFEVQSTIPEDADKEFVDLAVKYTRNGFAEVLNPLGRGAVVRLSDLVLHAVDFSGSRQQQFSAEHLAAALKSAR